MEDGFEVPLEPIGLRATLRCVDWSLRGVASVEGVSESSHVEAFARFYEEQLVPFSRLAFLLVGDSGLAEELAHDALSELQPRFDELEHPVAYARTVLVNMVGAQRRRGARRREAELRAAGRTQVDAETRGLFDVVERLPARQRAVIVLRYYEGLSESEIAATLRCRPGTVKSLVARALERLRKELSD